MKRMRIQKLWMLFLLVVVVLLLQSGIRLLHHHFDGSYYDSKDGFHTLVTIAAFPEKGVRPSINPDSHGTIPVNESFPLSDRTYKSESTPQYNLLASCHLLTGDTNRAPPA